MRSSHRLQGEIALRRRTETLRREVGDHEEGWGVYARRRNLARIEELERQLAEVTGELEVELEGKGVTSSGLTFSRLNGISPSLSGSLRGIGRDLLLTEGPEHDGSLRSLLEPVLASTGSGSFILRVARSPVTEQTTLLQPETLFERTAERFTSIFRAVQSDDAQSAIIQAVRGFRQPTIRALHTFAQQLTESDAPTFIRWRGEGVTPIRPTDAATVRDTLFAAEPTEESIEFTAELVGADVAESTFHLVRPADSEDEPAKNYKGKAAMSALGHLGQIDLPSPVSVTLTVLSIDSPALEKPIETYVLTTVTELL